MASPPEQDHVPSAPTSRVTRSGTRLAAIQHADCEGLSEPPRCRGAAGGSSPHPCQPRLGVPLDLVQALSPPAPSHGGAQLHGVWFHRWQAATALSPAARPCFGWGVATAAPGAPPELEASQARSAHRKPSVAASPAIAEARHSFASVAPVLVTLTFGHPGQLGQFHGRRRRQRRPARPAGCTNRSRPGRTGSPDLAPHPATAPPPPGHYRHQRSDLDHPRLPDTRDSRDCRAVAAAPYTGDLPGCRHGGLPPPGGRRTQVRSSWLTSRMRWLIRPCPLIVCRANCSPLRASAQGVRLSAPSAASIAACATVCSAAIRDSSCRARHPAVGPGCRTAPTAPEPPPNSAGRSQLLLAGGAGLRAGCRSRTHPAADPSRLRTPGSPSRAGSSWPQRCHTPEGRRQWPFQAPCHSS
jgi:hypothetical protein